MEGLAGGGDLLGIVLSHGHLDHVGLCHLAGPDLPVALGAATHRILRAAAPFVPNAWVPARPVEYESGVPFRMGPFTITPHLVDHSAYDAHALEVEAEGARLFYSGDLRAHGRKGALFERMIAHPPRGVDVMLMEGSSFGRIDPDAAFPTEGEVEDELVGLFRATDGLALVAASAQNIDRMVTLFRACKRTGRRLLIDLYAAEVLRATLNPRIPQSDWPEVAVWLPFGQRVHVKKNALFGTLARHKAHRVYPEALAGIAPRTAMLFRGSMLRDLERADCLGGARLVWSQWAGYLARPETRAMVERLKARGVPLCKAHTSGHAAIKDLRRLAAAVAPRRLVPVHTFEPGAFPAEFQNVTPMEDGEWQQI